MGMPFINKVEGSNMRAEYHLWDLNDVFDGVKLKFALYEISANEVGKNKSSVIFNFIQKLNTGGHFRFVYGYNPHAGHHCYAYAMEKPSEVPDYPTRRYSFEEGKVYTVWLLLHGGKLLMAVEDDEGNIDNFEADTNTSGRINSLSRAPESAALAGVFYMGSFAYDLSLLKVKKSVGSFILEVEEHSPEPYLKDMDKCYSSEKIIYGNSFVDKKLYHEWAISNSPRW